LLPPGVEGSRGWRKHRARGGRREVRRTGDIYPSKWREKGGRDPRVPALTRRAPARTRGAPTRSPALARGGTKGNGVSGDAGWWLGFARLQPGWGGRPGNQSVLGCIPRAWLAHIQGTKHTPNDVRNLFKISFLKK
jgi:hypothetical protein